MKWISLATVAVLSASACSTVQLDSPRPGWASLTLAEPDSPDSLSGLFYSVDGQRFPATSGTIFLKPGKRTVGYSCPGHLTLDEPPRTKAAFQAGAAYRLRCVRSVPTIEPVSP